MNIMKMLAVCVMMIFAAAMDVATQAEYRTRTHDTAKIKDTKVGKYKALIIGISAYKDAPLNTARKDAELVKNVLQERYGFPNENENDKKDIIILLDEDATKKGIEKALQDLRQNAHKEWAIKCDNGDKKDCDNDDSLLIFFAGHGDLDETGTDKKAWWVPIDGKKDDRSTFIKLNSVVEDIRDIKARHVLLISDSCFAGAIFYSRNLSTKPSDTITEARFESIYKTPSRRAMTSGRIQTVSDKSYDGKDNNHFAYILWKHLKYNKNRHLIFSQIYSDIQTEVENAVKGQVPRYDLISANTEGEFVFVARDIVKAQPSYQSQAAETNKQPEPFRNNDKNMEFVYLKSGDFIMGSPKDEQGRDDDETTPYGVILNGFYIQTTEVTQKQWERVMGDCPSFKQDCDDCPVENVSWNDAWIFIQKLNNDDKKPEGYEYQLPTEAQWEYACRAGSNTPFSFGSYISKDQANYNGNFPYYNCPPAQKKRQSTTIKAASLQPVIWKSYGTDEHELKIYGMHGNVWEWCLDIYDENPTSTFSSRVNPVYLDQSKTLNRVIRGGAWTTDGKSCRCAHRAWADPNETSIGIGFRLVLVKKGSR